MEHDWQPGTSGPEWTAGAWYRRAPHGVAPHRDWGACANVQQALPGQPHVKVFVQAGASPDGVNPVPYYLAGDVHLTHVSSVASDVGFGFARAWIRGQAAETSIESTAKFPLAGGALVLQPDVQYTLHPSGVHPAALAVGLRVHVTLY